MAAQGSLTTNPGEIGRLVQAIADGQPSKSFMAAIGEREAELKAITDGAVERGPGSLQEILNYLRTLFRGQLQEPAARADCSWFVEGAADERDI